MRRGILLAALFAAAMVAAENVVWIEGTGGEAGETVTVVIKATTDIPIRIGDLVFRYDELALEYMGADFGHGALADTAADVGTIMREGEPVFLLRFYIGFDRWGPFFPPTEDWEVARVYLRVKAGISRGTYAAGVVARDGVNETCYVLESGHSVHPEVIPGTVTVMASDRPTPPAGFRCAQELEDVELGWENLISYDSIVLHRDGARLATLPGDAISYVDGGPPLGAHTYAITGIAGTRATVGVECAVDVGPPMLVPVGDLSCEEGAEEATLAWNLPRGYERLVVSRNGEVRAVLEGVADSFTDGELPEGVIYYEVTGEIGEVASPPASCVLRGTWMMRLGSAEVPPGTTAVTIPLYVSAPLAWAAFSFAFPLDRERFDVEGATVEGTVLEPHWPFFLSARSRDDCPGTCATFGVQVCNAGGCIYLPPTVDACALNIHVSLSPSLPEGEIIPLSIEEGLGSPPIDIVMVGPRARCYWPDTMSGQIVIGTPAVRKVQGLNARGGESKGGVVLEWANGDRYDRIEVERNGVVLGELDGSEEGISDSVPGPGTYWYRVRGIRDGTESPWALAVYTDLPGASLFRRGDANEDGVVNLADAITLCMYLLRGEPVGCLDALDTNDDGRLNLADAVHLLSWLFVGREPPHAPGPDVRWIDPTPDGLDCRTGTP